MVRCVPHFWNHLQLDQSPWKTLNQANSLIVFQPAFGDLLEKWKSPVPLLRFDKSPQDCEDFYCNDNWAKATTFVLIRAGSTISPAQQQNQQLRALDNGICPQGYARPSREHSPDSPGDLKRFSNASDLRLPVALVACKPDQHKKLTCCARLSSNSSAVQTDWVWGFSIYDRQIRSSTPQQDHRTVSRPWTIFRFD